jgi:hypothetical protein
MSMPSNQILKRTKGFKQMIPPTTTSDTPSMKFGAKPTPPQMQMLRRTFTQDSDQLSVRTQKAAVEDNSKKKFMKGLRKTFTSIGLGLSAGGRKAPQGVDSRVGVHSLRIDPSIEERNKGTQEIIDARVKNGFTHTVRPNGTIVLEKEEITTPEMNAKISRIQGLDRTNEQKEALITAAREQTPHSFTRERVKLVPVDEKTTALQFVKDTRTKFLAKLENKIAKRKADNEAFQAAMTRWQQQKDEEVLKLAGLSGQQSSTSTPFSPERGQEYSRNRTSGYSPYASTSTTQDPITPSIAHPLQIRVAQEYGLDEHQSAKAVSALEQLSTAVNNYTPSGNRPPTPLAPDFQSAQQEVRRFVSGGPMPSRSVIKSIKQKRFSN